MTKRMLLSLCISAVALVAGEGNPTLPRTFAIDPAQTKVEFTLGSLLHTVHGEFRLKRGNLTLDPRNGSAHGELVVDATTGESGSPARDKRMHTSILESARYPEITFRPDRMDGMVALQGRSEVQLHGVFSIHGVDHELLVPAVVDAAGGQYAVDALFEVPYVKWGMKNPSTLMLRVNDKVEITIHTVAHTM
jgi:polyisoprenoid-binding protein YceI